MTVVDVNTGKFVGSGGNLEETVTKNNLEAAEEIVRQLRLRDIGGIIVVDFIDMVLESNRDLVLRRLVECLSRDRTKHQVAEVTSLGLVQMTRKKLGLGLLETFSEPCEVCAGRGVIVHHDPVDQAPADRRSPSRVAAAARAATGAATADSRPRLRRLRAADERRDPRDHRGREERARPDRREHDPALADARADRPPSRATDAERRRCRRKPVVDGAASRQPAAEAGCRDGRADGCRSPPRRRSPIAILDIPVTKRRRSNAAPDQHEGRRAAARLRARGAAGAEAAGPGSHRAVASRRASHAPGSSPPSRAAREPSD